ncbi:S24 family peptidase [Marinilactibacillus psychrotolerans]|uniref:Helix-turn-helix transcriptional regulator n=1 Tax=Marinilactibacillus psychrotolerans TaxID=191770 RepID=A0A511GZG0_9LACT|nr:S24 family peptidase [Marinilactibacillus psychrotolerans]TLQ04386.1 helix-turn-helix transcriptional regulator [Marinilactibacillus psychrotolerans]GEL66544.1 hypothetical protein MPS01_06990 [Marinilactibacillus psychrotolerans]GEQ35066.1 hypothetical protein M132T_05740 [Marinilactibacillus psychrotolerans]SDD20975.1 repressor LexA [Marinilactibacillus psychrotolerans]
MNREEKLKTMILKRFGTVKEFSRAVGLPYTTIRSILERGIFNAKLENVIKICKGLGISSEELIDQKDFVMEGSSAFYSDYTHSKSTSLFDDLNDLSEIDKVELPDLILGRYAGTEDIIFSRMSERSMDKLIPLNSLIGIKPVELADLNNEDIVVYSHQTERSIKHVYKIENKLILKPASHDPKFIDSVFEMTDTELNILGKIVLYIVEK